MVTYKTIFTKSGIVFVPPVYTDTEPKTQHYKSDHFIIGNLTTLHSFPYED